MTAQPKPETRPAGCCGKCPPIAGGGYDCTCEDNPRCTAQPKPTAAEVVAAHINCQWRGGLSLDCGSELPPPSSPDIRAAHIADVLAAAGLLATAEHDAQVLRDAAYAVQPLGGVIGATASHWLDARAARIAAGEEP